MGNFAQAVAQSEADSRCVAGKWISENFDKEDLEEFVRLTSDHKWRLIEQYSGYRLKEASLSRHVHGTCSCSNDVVAKGCCPCEKTERVS